MASPQSTLPTDDREEQDRRYNPGEQINQEKMAGSVSAGIDQAEAYANDPKNSTESVREQEEAGVAGGGFYEPSAGGKKQPITFKGILRKRGPLALIATFLVGGGGILSFLFTPALGLVNLKEVLVGDLNDQLSAYSLRSDTLLRTKIDQRSSGICTPLVKIRCQFSTMSQRQVERFRQAGFTIESGDTQDRPFGRERILRMTAPDGTVITNPQDLQNLTRTPNGRALVLRAFNPVYASFSDAVANKTFGRLGISKARWFDPAKGPQESARALIAGETNLTADIDTDPERGPYVVDPDASPPDNLVFEREQEDRYNQVLDQIEQNRAEVRDKIPTDLPGKAVSGVLSGAFKGAGILGAADASCTVYNTARAVGAAAKTARALQLAQFSMLYLNTADSILAGTATPEEVEFLGEKLAQVETTQKVIDETQTATTAGSPTEVFNNVQPTDNPDLGKSAYDSAGFKVAAYNEAPVLTAREQQYMVGGGLTGTFSGVADTIASRLGGAEGIRTTCGYIQSWWARAGGLAIGVIAAIGTGGGSLAVSVGASIAISAALPFLEAALVDILAGQVVDENTAGMDAGNAVFAGAAHIQGQVAQSRGLKPLTEDGLQEYLAVSKEVENQYVAAARIEAEDTPLDIMNQYSFLGSFARTLYTPTVQFGQSFEGTLASIPNILSTSLASIIPNASAQTAYNPERFERCNDAAYDELGIKADVFCNVRFGLSNAELALDPLAVAEFMYPAHVNSNGLPSSDAYKDFITYCVDREDGWGETGEEGTPDLQEKYTGAFCMEENATMSNFRVYTLDKSILDAMDEEEATVATTQSEIVSPVSPSASITSQFGPRTPPCSGCSNWHQGLDLVSSDRAVFSIMDGVVLGVTGINNVLSIRHEDGLVSTYWHMRRSDITVKEGDTVTAGQRVGTMGNEGQSRGVHLHIELNIAGAEDSDSYREQYIINTGGFNPGQRVDPLDYFRKNGVEGF